MAQHSSRSLVIQRSKQRVYDLSSNIRKCENIALAASRRDLLRAGSAGFASALIGTLVGSSQEAKAEIPVGGWVARHGLTAEQYQMAFNDFVGNHGMQLMDVSGYGAATPLYAALWVKTGSPPAWQGRHGLTAADYQATFNQLTAEGYHPVLVNGYATAAGTRFACIFQQGATGPWVARHGLTAQQYQAAFDEFTSQGYQLDWVSGYFDGQQDLYAAIWRQQPGAPAWQARHGLTPAQYQTTFDQLVAEGYRLELVSGYTSGGQDHIAAIWTK